MNTFKWTTTYLLLLSTILFFACKTENKPVEKEDAPSEDIDYKPMVLGNWLLEKAYRSGDEIKTLENTIFQFKEDGSVTSNFNDEGSPQNNHYIVEKDIITQTGQTEFTYLIKSATDSTLVLMTRYRGYGFQLNLARWEAEDVVQ